MLLVSGVACQQTSSFGVNSACEPSPCQNGASCDIVELSKNAVTGESIYGYKCTCLAGFTGDNCEIDFCSTNYLDCQNGATCELQTDAETGEVKAVCVCAEGFTGVLCNIPCDSAVSCGKIVSECTTNSDCSSENLVCVPDPDTQLLAQKCSLPVEPTLPCNYLADCTTNYCTVADDVSVGDNAGICDCEGTTYGQDCSYLVADCTQHGTLTKVKSSNAYGYCLCNSNYFGFTCGTNITTANMQVTNLANQTTLYTHNGQTYANIGYNLDLRPLGGGLNGSQFSMFMATSATGALSLCTAAVAGSGSWHAYPVSGANVTSGIYAYYIDSAEHANKGFYYLRFKDPHDTLSDCLAVTTPVWYGDKSCAVDTGSVVAHASFTSAAFNPTFPIVTGSCNLGYQGSGSITPKAYCEKDGTYAVITGACYPGDCGLASRPALPSHAVYLDTGTIYTGNAISASCSSGYSSPSTAALSGAIKCELNGTSGVVWGTGRITGACLGNSGAVCTSNSDCFETCINGVCKGKAAIGGSCDEAQDCADSNALCSSGSHQCVLAGLGFTCAGDGDCNVSANIHCSSTTGGTCGGATALCVNNQGCDSSQNLYCLPTGDAVNKTQACMLAANAGGKCNSNADCKYGNCTVANDDNFTGSVMGVCGGSGVVCHSGNIECDATATTASAKLYCRPSGGGQLCLSQAAAGASCNDHGDCIDGNCTATDAVSLTGICGGLGLPCTSNSGCASGTICAPGVTSGHYCIAPSIGGRCDASDDCPTGPIAINCGSGGICGGAGALCTTNAGCDTSGISTSQAVKYTCAPLTLGGSTSLCRDKTLLNAPCDNVDGDTDCDNSQRCAPIATAGTSGALYQCTTPVVGSICEDNTDCNTASNLYCSETTSGVPHGICGGSGARCTVNTDCHTGASLSCLPGTGNLYCLTRSATGGICNDHADCRSTVNGNYDVKCSLNTTTLTTGYCGGLNASCGSSAGSAIATTAANLQCASGYTCVNTTCTTYASLTSGTCDDHADCLGGLKCSSTGALPGTTGVCGGSGALCTTNSDCNTGANLSCIPGTGNLYCAVRAVTGGVCNDNADCSSTVGTNYDVKCSVNTAGLTTGYCGGLNASCGSSAGSAIATTAANLQCASGYTCVNTTCTTYASLTSGTCDDHADCLGGLKCSSTGALPGTTGACGGSGALCTTNSDCNTGANLSCLPGTGNLYCIARSLTGGVCNDNADCSSTVGTNYEVKCNVNTAGLTTGYCGGLNANCGSSSGSAIAPTAANLQCASGYTCVNTTCTTYASLTSGTCDDHADCLGGLKCSSTGALPGSTGTCGGSGALCTTNNDCNNSQNLYCIPDSVGTGQTCSVAGAKGSKCNANADCTGSSCTVTNDTSVGASAGICGGVGAFCTSSSNCLANYCRLSDNTCRSAQSLSLSYTDNPAVYTASVTISSNLPKLVGDPTGVYYHVDTAVSPSLPLNLVLDSTSGVISGTPVSPKVTDIYTIVATNPDGTEVRTQLTLTVKPATGPVIVTQPLSQTVKAPQTAVFTVVATGALEIQPLTYQWQKDGVAISGATLSSYQTAALTSADNGSVYRVIVSDPYGDQVVSDPAILVVGELVARSTYPVDCSDLKNLSPTSGSGVYTIDPDGPGDLSPFKVYCDLTTTGGGWTLVAAEYEGHGSTGWDAGIPSNYMVNSAAFTASLLNTYGGIATSFALNSAQLPIHTQTAFGSGSDPTFVGYSNFVYRTGEIYTGSTTGVAVTVRNLKDNLDYQVHRTLSGCFPNNNPEAVFSADCTASNTQNTLTYDQIGGALYSWAFGLATTGAGYALKGDKTSTSDPFAWTVWVRNTALMVNLTSISYSTNPAVYTLNTPITANTPTYSGGAAPLFYAISPDLPSGLVLNKTSGVITGTPLVAKPLTTYKVVAANLGNSVSTTLTLTVNDPSQATNTPPTSLSYTPNTTMTYYLQTLIYSGSVVSPPLLPTYAGGMPTAYSITPNLPIGIVFDTRTGIIDGAPLALSSNTSYTVVASNAAGSASTTLQISVQAPTTAPSNFGYKYHPIIYFVGIPLSSANSITGNINWRSIAYSINPALSTGLVFNSLNGDITGTPLAVSSSTNYIVSMTNSAGAGTGLVNIRVLMPPAPTSISYPLNPAVYYVGKSIDSSLNRPDVASALIASYAISPTSLPSGVIFNTRTGELSGTPLQAAALSNYTVVASNAAGSASTVIALSVHALASTGGGCNNNNACSVGYCSTNVTTDVFSGICGGTGAACGISGEVSTAANLECTSSNTCINQVCQPKPIVSYSCDDDSDCNDGSRCSVNGGTGGICGGAGAVCMATASANTQCNTAGGLSCLPLSLSSNSTLVCKALATVGSACNDSSDCATVSGQPVYCSIENQTLVGGVCGGSGAICPNSGNNSTCASGYICSPTSVAAPNGAHSCSLKSVGGNCDIAEGSLDCPSVSVGTNPVTQLSVSCGTNSICGSLGASCSSSTNTSSVTSNAQCLTASGLTCIYPACALKSSLGGPCDDNADCSVSNVKCSINTAPPGVGLGVCGGHGAACTGANDCVAGGSCTSGSCRLVPSGLSYFASSVTYYQGVPITPNVATLATGGGVTYSAVPSLPAGLTLNPTSGTITGTPTVVTGPPVVTTGTSPGTGYLINASNSAGTASVRLNIAVQALGELMPTQPTDETVLLGNPVTFIAGGYSTGSYSYQWMKNGVDIPGATSTSYTPTTSVSTGDITDSYKIRLTFSDAKSSTAPIVVSSNDVYIKVAKWDGIKEVGLGINHTCVLTFSGKVKCFGANASGYLGYGDTTSRGNNMSEMQFKLPYLAFPNRGNNSYIKALRLIKKHACTTFSDGTGLCWGDNSYYQLGFADNTSRSAPTGSILNATGVPIKDVNLGSYDTSYNTCLLFTNGDVRCFGFNQQNQCGISTANNNGGGDSISNNLSSNIVFGIDGVNNKSSFKKIVGASYLLCGLSLSGYVKCWGSGPGTLLPNGTTLPVANMAALNFGANTISDMSGMNAIYQVCGLLDSQQLKCAGSYNSYGALGYEDTNDHFADGTLPVVNVGSGRLVKSISGCTDFSFCAILEDNSLKCWGNNSHGELGLGDTVKRGDSTTAGHRMGDLLPTVPLGPLAQVKAQPYFGSATGHRCVILNNNHIKCWGGSGSDINALGLGLGNNLAHGDNDSTADHRMGEDLPFVPVLCPHNGLSYKFTPVIYKTGSAIVANLATVPTTQLLAYTVMPALPAGLTLNVTNGQITGTPTVASPETEYIVTANASTGAGNTKDYGSVATLLVLTVQDSLYPLITMPPKNQISFVGSTAIWKTYAVSTGTLTYQWQVQAQGTTGYVNISGATAASYTTPVLTIGNHGDAYRVVVSDGLGTATSTGALLTVLSSDGASQVTMGGAHTCVLSSSKKLKCFGDNATYGQLGYGDNTNRTTPPTAVVTSGGSAILVNKVVAGFCHTCTILSDQSVSCFGCNASGQLGINSTSSLNSPTVGVNLNGDQVQDIAVGGSDATCNHTCVVLANGDVKCFGCNSSGQLGYGDITNRADTTTVSYRSQDLVRLNLGTDEMGNNLLAQKVVAGKNFTCVLLNNQRVKCFGANASGQLGYGDTTTRGNTAASMGDNLPFVNFGAYRDGVLHVPWLVSDLAAGNTHVCALLSNRLNNYQMLKCFGANASGQLGYGDSVTRGNAVTAIDTNPVAGSMGDYLPLVDLGYLKTVQKLTVYGDSVCALLDTNRLKCFGLNDSGQLGYGDASNRSTALGKVMRDYLPTLGLGTGAVGLSKLSMSSSANAKHSCVLYSDGSVKCFGANSSGQLGYGDATTRGNSTAVTDSNLPNVSLGFPW